MTDEFEEYAVLHDVLAEADELTGDGMAMSDLSSAAGVASAERSVSPCALAPPTDAVDGGAEWENHIHPSANVKSPERHFERADNLTALHGAFEAFARLNSIGAEPAHRLPCAVNEPNVDVAKGSVVGGVARWTRANERLETGFDDQASFGAPAGIAVVLSTNAAAITLRGAVVSVELSAAEMRGDAEPATHATMDDSRSLAPAVLNANLRDCVELHGFRL